MNNLELTKQLQKAVASQRPLVHHITNMVTIYPCARIASFLGASPIMAFSPMEAADVTKKADALVINTGTLHEDMKKAIHSSIKAANECHIPVLLDPVGFSLSPYRYDFIMDLLDHYHIDVIRCNGAELMNIKGIIDIGKGIDGELSSHPDLSETAIDIARHYNCTVACSGQTDYISDGTQVIKLSRGSALLSRLVGTGCMLDSLIGSFLSVASTPLDASIAGILTMCLASETAQSHIKAMDPVNYKHHLGSFETALLDSIISVN